MSIKLLHTLDVINAFSNECLHITVPLLLNYFETSKCLNTMPLWLYLFLNFPRYHDVSKPFLNQAQSCYSENLINFVHIQNFSVIFLTAPTIRGTEVTYML